MNYDLFLYVVTKVFENAYHMHVPTLWLFLFLFSLNYAIMGFIRWPHGFKLIVSIKNPII